MVPVSVPPSVPVPVLRVMLMVVSVETRAALPLASCDCTTIENGLPAVGLTPPFTEMITSFDAAPACCPKRYGALRLSVGDAADREGAGAGGDRSCERAAQRARARLQRHAHGSVCADVGSVAVRVFRPHHN